MKERDNRYQTARDLLIDLRNLRRDLDLQSEIERSVLPNLSTTATSAGGLFSRDSVAASQKLDDHVVTQDVRALPTSSAEYLVSEIKRHKTGAFIVLISLLLLGAPCVYAAYRAVFRAQPSIAHFQNISMKKLTTLGNVSDVVISPDGKYVVYDLTEDNKQGLWTKYLPTGSTVSIVPSAEVLGLRATDFSRAGHVVHYVIRDANNQSR